MIIYTKNYDVPYIDKLEILKYLGIKSYDDGVLKLVDEVIKEAIPKISYKVCYGEISDLSFLKNCSKDLNEILKNCNAAVIFAATLGIDFDRLIAKNSKISPSNAVILDAIGSERIESLCNIFNKEVKDKYKDIKPRFSPGYGDFELKYQKELFKLLDCERKIGLTLNESLLMSPSKSVTAIIGIGRG